MLGAVPRGFSPWKMSQSTLIKTTINQLSLFCTLRGRERKRRKKEEEEGKQRAQRTEGRRQTQPINENSFAKGKNKLRVIKGSLRKT